MRICLLEMCPVARTLESTTTLEAVLTSVGKSRGSVNRFAAYCRVGGPATVLIQFTFSGVIIAMAEPEDRARVAAGQAGAITGGAVGGLAGMWAGCAGLSMLVSPSLVLPLVGEVTPGGACVIGGIAGGFGAGWVGGMLGQWGGESVHDFVTTIQWKS